MILDEADIDRLPPTTGLYDVAVHEMAHVLGFGTRWGGLRNPSSGLPDGVTVDTHFPGTNAVSAFDDAGGASYTGGKVPVENTRSSGRDSHWRQSIFHGEVMGPEISSGVGNPLSAVTIQSLADLGYSVDVSLADPYTVTIPGTDAERPAQAEAGPGTGDVIRLGDDILRIPLRLVDEDGRVVRVIQPGARFR